MKTTRIDWAAVRSRVQNSERLLEEALQDTPHRIETAYERRAARLAEPPLDRRLLAARIPVLVFTLAQERYAVELKEVAETLPLSACTPVPGAPPHLLGVINLRGELRGVVDLGHLIGVNTVEEKESGFVLILARSGRQIGCKVDRIEDVREIPSQELSACAQGKYTRSIAAGALMLLDVDAVLAEVSS